MQTIRSRRQDPPSAFSRENLDLVHGRGFVRFSCSLLNSMSTALIHSGLDLMFSSTLYISLLKWLNILIYILNISHKYYIYSKQMCLLEVQEVQGD